MPPPFGSSFASCIVSPHRHSGISIGSVRTGLGRDLPREGKASSMLLQRTIPYNGSTALRCAVVADIEALAGSAISKALSSFACWLMLEGVVFNYLANNPPGETQCLRSRRPSAGPVMYEAEPCPRLAHAARSSQSRQGNGTASPVSTSRAAFGLADTQPTSDELLPFPSSIRLSGNRMPVTKSLP